MREIKGDLWNIPADIRVITTNGTVRNGKNVMGAGCAKEAKDKHPELPEKYGKLIGKRGNTVMFLKNDLVALPVKHQVWESADIALVDQSIRDLVAKIDIISVSREKPIETVLIPRPGCGYGGLNWDEVKSVIEPNLDDRFAIVSFEDED